MASADSLAMSTAVSTEMPTSAAEGRGVVDAVAQEPHDVPARSAAHLMTRCLWAGDSRANRRRLPAASASSASDIPSTWRPGARGRWRCRPPGKSCGSPVRCRR